MRPRRILLSIVAVGCLTSSTASAQSDGIGEQLAARGAPAEFVAEVEDIVAAARNAGLPSAPLASKALEGWAKRGRIPPDRVLMVLEELSARLVAARDAVATAGLDPVPGSVVASAAEALGRGMSMDEVRDLIMTAPTPQEAATGLMVASALAAQGLGSAAAVQAVHDAHLAGRPSEEVLEFPSALASLVSRGVPMADVAGMILRGGTLPLPSTAGGAASRRPQNVPPGRGRRPNRP